MQGAGRIGKDAAPEARPGIASKTAGPTADGSGVVSFRVAGHPRSRVVIAVTAVVALLAGIGMYMLTTSGGPPPANAGNGTMPNNEPRRIKTLSVRGDQPDGAGVPAASQPPGAKPSAAARAARNSPVPAAAANANASTANGPLLLSPQAGQSAPAADPRTRVATNTPTQTTPSGGGGGYLVQVSSQKNEADAQSSYRVLQGKYPSVLGSQSVVVKRVDLGAKGVYYRAFAGPFGSPDQATQVCNNLKAAGGPLCLIQRN